MSNQELSDLLNNEVLNTAITIVKTTISFNPIGSFVSNIFSNWQNEIHFNAIKEILDGFKNKLEELDSKVDKNYLNSKEFAIDFLKVLNSAKEEINKEKLRVYADFLTSCTLSVNIGERNKALYLDMLEKIDYTEFLVLSFVPKDYKGCDIVKSVHSTLIRKNILCDIKDIQMRFIHLESLGLICLCDEDKVRRFAERTGQKMPRNYRKANYYQHSILGNRLICFITQQ